MLQNLWLSRVKRRRRGSLMELHLLRTRQHLVLTLQDDFTNVSCRIMTIMANSKSYEPLIRCICILSQKPQRVISAEDGDRGLTAALWVEESKKGFLQETSICRYNGQIKDGLMEGKSSN
jgi:hypothetical protein